MRAKALCVIETVLKVEAERGGEVHAYTDFFHACAAEIEPLAGHARASVKGPAKRVLAMAHHLPQIVFRVCFHHTYGPLTVVTKRPSGTESMLLS